MEIRDLRKGVGIRADKEHVAAATASAGGEHKEGSAKAYYEAAEPTQRPDAATNLDATDAGRIWIDSDNDSMKIYDGSAFVTPTVGIGASGQTDIATEIKAAGGYTNATGSPILVNFQGTGTVAFDLEIDYAGGGWVKFIDSCGLSGLSHQICMGSVIIPNGGKIRFNPAPNHVGRGRFQTLA
jgi:hypothetical protein